MKKNAGNIDRAVRVVAGLAILSTAVVGPQTPLGYIGVIPLATGALGWCPLYTLFGFSTCPLERSKT